MIIRSNSKRTKETDSPERGEEKCVILTAIKHEGKQSSEEYSFDDFQCSQDTFSDGMLGEEDHRTSGRIFASSEKSLDNHCVGLKSETMEQNLKRCDICKNLEGSSEKFPHQYSQVSLSIGRLCSPEDFSLSKCKTQYSDFSHCYSCNAVLADKALQKWRTSCENEDNSFFKSPVSSLALESFNTNGSAVKHHPQNFEENIPPVQSLSASYKNINSGKCNTWWRNMKSPLRTSSPEPLITGSTRSELGGREFSIESLSTIGDRENSDISSAKENPEMGNHLILHAAEIVETDCAEEQVTELTNTLPYNIEYFLKDALGDELMTSCDSDSQNANTGIQENDESLMDNNEEPLYHTIKSYRTLTTLGKQKIRPSLQTSMKINLLEEAASPENKKEHIQSAVQSLLAEAEVYTSIISQTSKALELCETSKYFISSLEKVESERLLLIATHKRNAAFNEIHRLKFGEQSDVDISYEKGTLHITGLSLQLKDDFIKYSSSEAAETTTWFLCLLTHKEKVIATEAVADVQGNCVNFPGSYSFTDLRNDFFIKMQIYNLRLRKNIRGHYSKYFAMVPSNAMCPVPCKKVKNVSQHDIYVLSGKVIQTSAFSPIGELHIRLSDTHSRNTWQLNKVPLSSPLSGTINMNLKTALKLTAEYSGFLNMFEEMCVPGAWQKYWFCLREYILQYWNYPTEKDIKDPVGEINLSYCLTKSIEPVTRNVCPRPRTFLIETRRRQGDTSIFSRHFLSADTGTEMMQWCSALNKVITTLRDWNLMT